MGFKNCFNEIYLNFVTREASKMNPKQDPVTMPPKDDNMEQISLRLPKPALRRLEEIAERRNVDRATMIRMAVERGLPGLLQEESVEVEYENKQLVNEKLKLSISRLKQGKAPDDI